MDEQKNNLGDRALKSLQKEFIVVGKTSIKGWHAWLTLGVIAGITAGVLFVANRGGEFELTKAFGIPISKRPPKNQQSNIIVNVKDFGAKGDGVNDDSSAIQSAIDSLTETGGTVDIPAGTYMLGTSHRGVNDIGNLPFGDPIETAILISGNNITLKGVTASVLKLMPGVRMRALSVIGDNVTINGIIVDGNKLQRDGKTDVTSRSSDVVDALVYFLGVATKGTIKNCEVKNGIEDGIGFWKSDDAHVANCYSHDNGTDQAGGAGIALSGGANARAINNIIVSNTGTGIWAAFDSSNVEIRNNTIKNNKSGGITIGGGTAFNGLGLNNKGFTIEGNTIEGNGVGTGSGGFAALTIFSSSNGTVSKNTIIDNHYTGIHISGVSTVRSVNWMIENNICSNVDKNRVQSIGIRVSVANDITLRNNTCRNNGTSIYHQIVVDRVPAITNNWKAENTISYDP